MPNPNLMGATFYLEPLTTPSVPLCLEWVIDQYQVSTDKRSGITNDPNRPDDERYILRLIAQVITVSLETQQIIAALPSLNLPI